MVDDGRFAGVVNSSATADLAWDYTGDESSPLLRNAVSGLCRPEKKCVLTQAQVKYLLDNLKEVSQILNNELIVNRTVEIHPDDDEDGTNSHFPFFTKASLRVCFCVKSFNVVIAVIIILLLSMLVDTLLDISDPSHVPYISYATSIICSLGVVYNYSILLKNAIKYQRLTLGSILLSYMVSILCFALLYTICHCVHASKELPQKELFISRIYDDLHTSICVFTFSYYGQLKTQSWDLLLILSIQTLLSYCHFIAIISTSLTKVLHSQTKPAEAVSSLVEDQNAATQAQLFETGSYTFNPGRNIYGSLDASSREFEVNGGDPLARLVNTE